MRIDETQKMINDYFGVMGAHGDFSQFYAEDVTWIMIDAGVETRGAAAVRDYVVALHGQMTDVHPIGLRFRRGGMSRRRPHQRAEDRRTPHCLLVVYDLADNRITAMRCYGTFGEMVSQIQSAD